MEGLEKKESALLVQKQSFENQIVVLGTQIASLQGKIKARSQKETQQASVSGGEIDSLRKEILRLDELMVSLTSGAVKPKDITSVLKRVLTDVKGLRVARMNVLDATPLDENALADIKKYVTTKVSRLYKHEIEIELHGNYFSTYEYLRKLESYSKVFYWNEITYKALSWPTALITLKVYTLSSRRDGEGA
jgi:MSHA biogenesis protein MshJ